MRSEDRKPSKRVFPLLQNLDLNNVTFAQVQGVGDPITIEDMNEQELQDLVLVNLARLAVSGEWTGLLEAGGGGGDSGYGILPPITEVGAYDGYQITMLAPWGAAQGTPSGMNAASYPQSFPFVSPATGELTEIEIQVNTTTASSTLVVAIYEQDDTTHMPSTMLGYVTFDTESATGTVGQTSFSGGTPSLTAGVQYWCSQARGTTAYAGLYGIPEESRGGLGRSNYPLNNNNQITNVGNWATANPVDDIGALNQYVGGVSLSVILKF